MAVAFTLSAIFVVVDPIANVFHSPFWMGKEKKKKQTSFLTVQDRCGRGSRFR
jgi:hypothetical protein